MSMSRIVLTACVSMVATETAAADSPIPEALSGRNIIVNRQPAYLSVPAGVSAGDAGVILVPGEGAVNDDVRHVVDRFAAAGLIAIAVTTNGEETVATIAQAASMLRERPFLRAKRIGIVGAGESARWALAAAAGAVNLSAVVTYDAPWDDQQRDRLRAPHLGLMGVAPGDDAGAARVWQQTVDFLRDHLGVAQQHQPTSAWTAPFGVPGASPEQTAQARGSER